MTIAIQRFTVWLGVIAVGALIGALVPFNPQLAFVATLTVLGVAALAAPASCWALAALVGALTFRGLVTLGALPSVATFADIPLAWGALAAAVMRTILQPSGTSTALTRRYVRWLVTLGVVVLVSWAFSSAELIRPVLYFALLAEPFALIAALVLDPPSQRVRRAIIGTALALVLIQIPIAFWQATTLGINGDHVQGTLHGAGAGHHTISAVVTVGAIWIAMMKRYPFLLRCAVVLSLAAIPFLADAKQVILAFPAVLIVGRWSSAKEIIVRAAAAAGVVAALILVGPNGRSAVRFLDQTSSGHGGKEQAAKVVWDSAKTDPATVVFGHGPAETVSRAAFMTTDSFLHANSPLRVFHLKPAQIALQADSSAIRVSGGGSSFNSGLSSALGVFGDLGIAGLVAYVGLLGSVLLAVRKIGSPEGIAAGAGLAMFAVLGLVFDWWEQPPFSVFLAVLAGLALSVNYRSPKLSQG